MGTAMAIACGTSYEEAPSVDGADATVPSAEAGPSPATDAGEEDATLDAGELPCSPGQTRTVRRNPRNSVTDSGISTKGGGSTGTFGPEWASPASVAKKDGVTSSVVLTKERPGSRFLITRDYGFQVPVGASIRGILLTADPSTLQAQPTVRVTVPAIGQLTEMSRGDANPTITGTPISIGGDLDTWGRTWTPAEINAAGFSAVFLVSATFPADAGPDASQTVSVDEVAVEVFYDCP